MIEKVELISEGVLTLAGQKKRIYGKLYLNHSEAEYLNLKGVPVLRFRFADIAKMDTQRHGKLTSTIWITLRDGSTFGIYLEKGIVVYQHLDTHWTTKPVEAKTRADELHRLAYLHGDNVVKPRRKLIRRRKPNRSIGGDIIIYLGLAIIALAMAFPIIFAVGASLKPLDELFRFPPTVLPKQPTMDNYADLIVTMGQSWVPFSRYIFNTVFITAVGTFGHLIIASMAAFVLAKYDFPGGKLFFAVVTTCLMFSGYVTGIPNYIIMSKLGMIDTYWSLLLPAFAAPIGLFMMKQFMESLPTPLIEAAHIDGANEFRVFWNIVMPNVKPAWLTVIIFSVQGLWNNSASTVIYSEAKKTLVYALQQIQAGGVARTGQAAAVTVITMIVPIVIFIFSQSQILETMASSGIKE